MLVCHCNGITDRAIRHAVRNGAQTTAEVARACGAGSGCGGCLRTVTQLIHRESAHRVAAQSTPPNTNSANT